MKRKKNSKPNKLQDETLERLLKRLGISKWDFVIVGDGSGSGWTREAGWASVSIERETGERQIWSGCVNRGTVNFAEAMAYMQPLTWLAAREAERRKSARTRAWQVHIITDSEYCQTAGTNGCRSSASNSALWAAFSAFNMAGLILQWHWVPRDSCELNRLCDAVSKVARQREKSWQLDVGESQLRVAANANPYSAGDSL